LGRKKIFHSYRVGDGMLKGGANMAGRLLTDNEIRKAYKKAMDEGQLYGDDGRPLPEKGVAITQDLKTVSIIRAEQNKTICPECDGRGIVSETGRGSDGFIRCENCNGEGKVLIGAGDGITCPSAEKCNILPPQSSKGTE